MSYLATVTLSSMSTMDATRIELMRIEQALDATAPTDEGGTLVCFFFSKKKNQNIFIVFVVVFCFFFVVKASRSCGTYYWFKNAKACKIK